MRADTVIWARLCRRSRQEYGELNNTFADGSAEKLITIRLWTNATAAAAVAIQQLLRFGLIVTRVQRVYRVVIVIAREPDGAYKDGKKTPCIKRIVGLKMCVLNNTLA